MSTETVTQCQLIPDRSIPTIRPLEFAETTFKGDKVWMLCIPQPEIPANEVAEFHRVQIHEDLYTTKQLKTIHAIALRQREPAELLLWIGEAISRSLVKVAEE